MMEAIADRLVLEAALDAWRLASKESRLRVSGYSMRPLIQFGDNVIVRHGTKGIAPGVPIAYKRGRRIVVHRVLRCYDVDGKLMVVCRGDANRFADKRVGEDAIIGRVTSVVNQRGHARNFESMFWRQVGLLIVRLTEMTRHMPSGLRHHWLLWKSGRAMLKVLSWL
jgi:signal peptidase I